jgi:hypothetical protein
MTMEPPSSASVASPHARPHHTTASALTSESYAEIRGLLAPLPDGARARTEAPFALLAEAEARVHGVAIDLMTSSPARNAAFRETLALFVKPHVLVVDEVSETIVVKDRDAVLGMPVRREDHRALLDVALVDDGTFAASLPYAR